MTTNNEAVVQMAVAHFKQGRYQQAKTYYQQAARRYGHHLFANNIRLCDLRINGSSASTAVISQVAESTLVATQTDAALAQQLEETQKLLENYFKRCQELEYQLLDRQ